jgi:putative glutamine amidotransferase
MTEEAKKQVMAMF